jgi:hypothetical protein
MLEFAHRQGGHDLLGDWRQPVVLFRQGSELGVVHRLALDRGAISRFVRGRPSDGWPTLTHRRARFTPDAVNGDVSLVCR